MICPTCDQEREGPHEPLVRVLRMWLKRTCATRRACIELNKRYQLLRQHLIGVDAINPEVWPDSKKDCDY